MNDMVAAIETAGADYLRLLGLVAARLADAKAAHERMMQAGADYQAALQAGKIPPAGKDALLRVNVLVEDCDAVSQEIGKLMYSF